MKTTFLVLATIIAASQLCFAELPINELPKYGNDPDYETIWSRTAADERRMTMKSSRDASKRGWEFLRRGDVSTAIKRFNQAWTLYPDNPEALWGMAIVLLERAKKLEGKVLEKTLDEALTLIDEARALDAINPPLLVDAALIYATRGGLRRSLGDKSSNEDFSTSESLLRSAEGLAQHPGIYETWAALKRYMGDEQAAEVMEKRAVALRRKSPQ